MSEIFSYNLECYRYGQHFAFMFMYLPNDIQIFHALKLSNVLLVCFFQLCFGC